MTSQSRSRKTKKPLYAHLSDKYYTAQEAQNVLGMDRNTFNNRVRKGLIKRTVIEGLGDHGLYAKSHIDDLAAALEAALLAADVKNLIFRKAELTDLDAINYLAYLHFGDGALTPERKAARQHYLEVNPFSTFCLFNFDKLLASMDIVPLTHTAIPEFREGKRGWQFPNSIKQFAPGEPLELIIIDMMVTPNAPPKIRESYARDLLRGLSRQFQEWGSQGVEIVTIDACGGTELGRRILETGGFQYTGEKQPRRHMYHLDMATSDLKLLRPYKAALEAYKAAHKV